MHLSGDWVALPAEHRSHFTEKLLLLPPTYIVNDYAQMQGDILYLTNEDRSPRSSLEPDISLDQATVLFGSFSNSQKFDPFVFSSWMNILSSVPGSQMMMLKFSGGHMVIGNLRRLALAYGISINRLAVTEVIPWIDHMHTKTSVDLILDTTIKNGHTTGLDGVWAGVPTISLGLGRDMSTRAAESIAVALGSELGLGYTLKEYENLAVSYTREVSVSYNRDGAKASRKRMTPWKLHILREYTEKLRVTSSLFDTKLWADDFTRMMEVTLELRYLADLEYNRREAKLKKGELNPSPRSYHIFARTRGVEGDTSASSSLLQVAQAIEGGVASSWAAKVQSKQRFRDKFGYDPESASRLRTTYSEIKPVKPSALSQVIALASRPNTTLTASPLNPGSSTAPTIAQNSGKFHHERLCEPFHALPLNSVVLKSPYVMLNIGGYTTSPDWYSVNIQPASEMSYKAGSAQVDIIRQMHDLQGFPNASVSAIYASHVLEHTSTGDSLLHLTLREWRRVLRPGGLLFVAVPDMTVLAGLFVNKTLTAAERVFVLRMIFGGQVDAYDYHKVSGNCYQAF